jgi:hypothetical protein
MQTRLILIALVAFTLGAAVDRIARITNYDQRIATMGHTIDTQRKLIDELQKERAEVRAVLEASE